MAWDEIQGQERAVRLLRRALEGGKPHHAYLLTGPEGVGKELLARIFVQAANCEAEGPPAARPCGKCVACTGILRGSYPDVFWVMPQSELVARGLLNKGDLEAAPSRDIRVDEVRAVSRRLSFAPVRGSRKIAIVTPADALNERAQNTLLKTLEEPPPLTTFLLITSQPDVLLPTVRSRCARVQLQPLSAELIASLLIKQGMPEPEARTRAASAEGSLAHALALSGDEIAQRRDRVQLIDAAMRAPDERAALDAAESFGERAPALETLAAVLSWTRDQLVAAAAPLPRNDLSAASPGVSPSPGVLLAQHKLCNQVLEALEQNGNPRLQLERLFLGMRELRRPAIAAALQAAAGAGHGAPSGGGRG